MNTTRTIALTLAAIAGTATIGTATAAATTNCNGRAALNAITIDIHDSTYTATFTPTPGCDNTPITIAAHDTAHLTWDPTEVQPLIASMTVPASAGRLEWTLPAGVAPRCRLQLDFVTGPALDVVDGAHRYNETAIGGTSNRLIDARYTEAPCTPTTSTPTSTTVTSLPPVTVTRVTELPPATLPPVPPGQPVTTLPDGLDLVGLIPSPTPYTAVPTPPRLPETGADMGIKVMLGAGLIFFGGLLTALRRHGATHQHPVRNMESE